MTSAIKKIAAKNKQIYDVAVFGSVVRGKKQPTDIDIAIIMETKTTEEENLLISQQLRQGLESLGKKINIEVVSFDDFLDESFLARQGILGESHLILHKKPFSEMLGFKTFVLFRFNLVGLSNSQKTKFNYALNGRKGSSGILEQLSCDHIGPGAIKVPVQKTEEFKSFLQTHRIKFTTETAMFYNFS